MATGCTCIMPAATLDFEDPGADQVPSTQASKADKASRAAFAGSGVSFANAWESGSVARCHRCACFASMKCTAAGRAEPHKPAYLDGRLSATYMEPAT